MGTTAFGAQVGGYGSCLGHFEKILQFQCFDTRSVERLALVIYLHGRNASAQIGQLFDTFFHELASTEHTEVVLHAVLQFLAQRRNVFASGAAVQRIQTAQ